MYTINSGNIEFTEVSNKTRRIVEDYPTKMGWVDDGTELQIEDLYGDMEDILDEIAKADGNHIVSGYISYHGDYDGAFFWDESECRFYQYSADDAMSHVIEWHNERKGYVDRYRQVLRAYFDSPDKEDRVIKNYMLREMEFVLEFAFNVSRDECKRIYGEEYAEKYFGREKV